MERVILHVDANSFYASIECLYNPAIRDKPVAVCGDPETRHGIVLTANRIAKQEGCKTGMAIWQARQACPGLVVVPPDYRLYLHFARMMRDIFNRYSDRVEPFGLDEAWIDLSNDGVTIRDGKRAADEMRDLIRNELGITASAGVSFNKVFAKLGSDIKKPDATTVLPLDGFREKINGLPASELLYVGPKTAKKLCALNIHTIGELAACSPGVLTGRFGKNGLMMQSFAQGLDTAPVMPTGAEAAIQSIGNSTTAPHDIENMRDARCIFYLLAESVAARLRDHGFRAKNISISARTAELITNSCQRMLKQPTNLTGEIAGMCMALFEERFAKGFPFRSVGVSCGMLQPACAPVQTDLLGVQLKREKMETMERTLDDIRKRYGHQAVQRGVVLADRRYAAVNPKEDHTIHPVPFFAG
jgi:DNA polymerase IV